MKKFNQFMAEANICSVCNSEPCTCPGGDNHITESDAAWAAAEAKRKEQEAKKALTKKDASTVDKIRAMMAKEKMKEEVEIEEANTPSDADLHKTLGPTKNMQQGVDALKKKHGMSDDEAKKHIRRLMGMKEEAEMEEGLQQTLRKFVPGYAKKQIDKKMDDQKFGKRDVDKDANYWRYKKVQDKLKKEEVTMNEAKDEQEYGYEGAMAMTQLKTLTRHAEHMMGMMKEDTDLPEWVQSKITLATDYVQTAHDYLMSEMNEELSKSAEQIDELSKSTLGSYIRKASGNAASATRAAGVEAGARGPKRFANMDSKEKRAEKRLSGVSKAVDRLAKEDVEENYVSHAQRKAVWAARNDEKMKKEDMHTDKKEDPPFDGPYSKKKVATPGKQGYGMSAARHLARQALQKVADKQKNK